jgi:hypothetical protein
MKLTRRQIRGLVTEMLGMGGPDPELVKQLQPFLDRMRQNPGAYAMPLEEFEDGSAYDPMMGGTLENAMDMIGRSAKRAGDMDMLNMINSTVLDGGQTLAQSRQAEQEAFMGGMAGMDDPTAMADPFAVMPTRELSQGTPIGDLSESREHLQEMISPEAFNLLFKLTREFISQAKASGASEEQIQGVVDAAIEQPDLPQAPLPPDPVTPDPNNPGLDPAKQNRPAFGTLQRGWLDYLKEDDRAESLNESSDTFARWNLIAGLPQKKTK